MVVDTIPLCLFLSSYTGRMLARKEKRNTSAIKEYKLLSVQLSVHNDNGEYAEKDGDDEDEEEEGIVIYNKL